MTQIRITQDETITVEGVTITLDKTGSCSQGNSAAVATGFAKMS